MGRLPSPAAAPARAAIGAGLPDALLACVVLGLGVAGWLRLPAITAREALAARQHQQASQAAANLAQWLHALRTVSGAPLPTPSRRVLLPAPDSPAPDCRRHECTPPQMLEFGWREWALDTARLLPGARAEIACRPAHDTDALAAQAGPGSDDRVCTLTMRPPHGREPAWQWSLRA